jgi:hypothetical protein
MVVGLVGVVVGLVGWLGGHVGGLDRWPAVLIPATPPPHTHAHTRSPPPKKSTQTYLFQRLLVHGHLRPVHLLGVARQRAPHQLLVEGLQEGGPCRYLLFIQGLDQVGEEVGQLPVFFGGGVVLCVFCASRVCIIFRLYCDVLGGVLHEQLEEPRGMCRQSGLIPPPPAQRTCP